MKAAISPFLKIEITNEALRAASFPKMCEAAALKDDGMVTKDEQKVIDELNTITKKYVKALEKLVG